MKWVSPDQVSWFWEFLFPMHRPLIGYALIGDYSYSYSYTLILDRRVASCAKEVLLKSIS